MPRKVYTGPRGGQYINYYGKKQYLAKFKNKFGEPYITDDYKVYRNLDSVPEEQRSTVMTCNDDLFRDPITFDYLIDPVLASDGHVYERETINRIISTTNISPLTRDQLVGPHAGRYIPANDSDAKKIKDREIKDVLDNPTSVPNFNSVNSLYLGSYRYPMGGPMIWRDPQGGNHVAVTLGQNGLIPLPMFKKRMEVIRAICKGIRTREDKDNIGSERGDIKTWADAEKVAQINKITKEAAMEANARIVRKRWKNLLQNKDRYKDIRIENQIRSERERAQQRYEFSNSGRANSIQFNITNPVNQNYARQLANDRRIRKEDLHRALTRLNPNMFNGAERNFLVPEDLWERHQDETGQDRGLIHYWNIDGHEDARLGTRIIPLKWNQLEREERARQGWIEGFDPNMVIRNGGRMVHRGGAYWYNTITHELSIRPPILRQRAHPPSPLAERPPLPVLGYDPEHRWGVGAAVPGGPVYR